MIYLPEPQHQALASSERQVTVLGPEADSPLSAQFPSATCVVRPGYSPALPRSIHRPSPSLGRGATIFVGDFPQTPREALRRGNVGAESNIPSQDIAAFSQQL